MDKVFAHTWILFLLLFVGTTMSMSPVNSSSNNTELLPLGPSMEQTGTELTWKILADVQFKDVYLADLDAYYWKPTFGASVKALEGKDVFITGYLIPVDADENFYVLSRYPFANCFFCGGAGPESVIDLRFKGDHRVYKTDERLTFKGKFKLNSTDIYQMNYILDGAVEAK
jgi:hypothetical protein